jgi:predicted nucleic acid-binding protein
MRVHAENANLPIRAADAAGAFPDANYGGLIRQESLVVVPDTNILLEDIADSCERGKRLVLVTATNTGAIRLICSQQVVDEVSKNAVEHALCTRVDPADFLWRWQHEYLPQLRIVPHGAIPAEVFTPYELKRIRRLNGSKDTPSVMLALALGAFYLSKDEAPWKAVYDTIADKDVLLDWLAPVRGGSTADELSKIGFAAMILPALAFQAIGQGYQTIRRHTPFAFVPLLALLAYGAYKVPRDKYNDVLRGVGYATEVFMAMRYRYEQALERFNAMAPPVPLWEKLADAASRRSVLHRACLMALARSPHSQRSATELASMLPDTFVGQSSPLVREVLRAQPSFYEPYRGRWQVGAPSPNEAHSLANGDAKPL